MISVPASRNLAINQQSAGIGDVDVGFQYLQGILKVKGGFLFGTLSKTKTYLTVDK